MKEKKNKAKNTNKRNTRNTRNNITNNKNPINKRNKGIKRDQNVATADRSKHRRFIIEGIEKQALRQQTKDLDIKKTRKCKGKKNKYLVSLNNPKRVQEFQTKLKEKNSSNVATSVVVAKKRENFLEEEYSNHSDSYIELEQFQELQKKMQELQHQREQDLLDQKKLQLEQQEQTLKLKLSCEDKILALTHEFQQQQQQQQQQYKALQQEFQEKNEQQQKEAQLQLSQLQTKVDQYESYQFQNVLQGLNGFKNYLESNEIQAKITKFSSKFKNQKYNQKQMSRDEQIAEDQALAQIAYKFLTMIATTPNNNSENSNKTTPYKYCN